MLWLSKHQPDLFSNFGTSKYVGRCLLYLLVIMLYLLFSGILHWNCINRTYRVAVYTLNIRSSPCCLFVITENVPFIFGLQNNRRTVFPSSKPQNMLDGNLFVVCLPPNTFFMLFFGILTCNCMRRTYLFAVSTLNTPSKPYC